MVSVANVSPDNIDKALWNLLNLVDNIDTPKTEDLKDLIALDKGKLLEMKTPEGGLIAYFFVSIEGNSLILDCMLGDGKGEVDPIKALITYGEKLCESRGLRKLIVNTKRAGVAKRFINLGFSVKYISLEKEI